MPSSHGFHKLVIKSKNVCKDIKKKTIFLDFLYLRMLNHAMYFYYYYLCKCDFFRDLAICN